MSFDPPAEITPPRGAPYSRMTPFEFLLSSPVEKTVKRKLGYVSSNEDKQNLRYDLAPYPTDTTVLDMHDRQSQLNGPERKKMRVLLEPYFLRRMIDKLTTLEAKLEKLTDTGERLEHRIQQLEHENQQLQHQYQQLQHQIQQLEHQIQQMNARNRHENQHCYHIFRANVFCDLVKMILKYKSTQKKHNSRNKPGFEAHDTNRLVTLAKSIQVEDVVTLGLSTQYFDLIKKTSEINEAAHETANAFAQFLKDNVDYEQNLDDAAAAMELEDDDSPF
ncbi:MAG: hypothetical protein M1816_005362 [Peltula sp. TS41687]|nr:MAG: hypothetical protein M1816_005362 [Peltula sp. TS41687]